MINRYKIAHFRPRPLALRRASGDALLLTTLRKIKLFTLLGGQVVNDISRQTEWLQSKTCQVLTVLYTLPLFQLAEDTGLVRVRMVLAYIPLRCNYLDGNLSNEICIFSSSGCLTGHRLPATTLRELSMVRLMDHLTDKPGWAEKVGKYRYSRNTSFLNLLSSGLLSSPHS